MTTIYLMWAITMIILYGERKQGPIASLLLMVLVSVAGLFALVFDGFI